ncbi:hypothetical protein U1Q18_051559 [Sarracenia purpurea var. burkii]
MYLVSVTSTYIITKPSHRHTWVYPVLLVTVGRIALHLRRQPVRGSGCQRRIQVLTYLGVAVAEHQTRWPTRRSAANCFSRSNLANSSWSLTSWLVTRFEAAAAAAIRASFAMMMVTERRDTKEERKGVAARQGSSYGMDIAVTLAES